MISFVPAIDTYLTATSVNASEEECKRFKTYLDSIEHESAYMSKGYLGNSDDMRLIAAVMVPKDVEHMAVIIGTAKVNDTRIDKVIKPGISVAMRMKDVDWDTVMCDNGPSSKRIVLRTREEYQFMVIETGLSKLRNVKEDNIDKLSNAKIVEAFAKHYSISKDDIVVMRIEDAEG